MKPLTGALKKPLDITPHLIIITSTLLLTLWVTDRFNGAMHFIAHDMTSWLVILAAAVFAFQSAIYLSGTDSKGARLVYKIITVLGCVIAIYLMTVCLTDLTSGAAPLMLRDSNKFALLGYCIISVFCSALTAVTRRREKIDANRRAAFYEKQNKNNV